MPPLKIITFMVGDRRFALPSRQVKEIIESEQGVKPLFYGGDLLKGLVDYSGDLISVLNFPLLLDISEPVECPSILVCRDKESGVSVALTISEVLGIERVGVGRIEAASDSDAGYVKGLIKAVRGGKGNAAVLIDLAKISAQGIAGIKENNGFVEYGEK